MAEGDTCGPNAEQSGWVTTKVAARTLRVDPRTVRKYIKQGKLVAKAEGEGVDKAYLVSIDSVYELRSTRPDPRVHRDSVPHESAGSASTADPAADLVDLVRDLTSEVTRRSSEAAELRTRLELTERAESSQREALEQRLETERLRREQAEHNLEQAQRERDEALEILRGAQVDPETISERFRSETESEDSPEPPERRLWWQRWFSGG
jgi:DNA-binding transcriptional MerR regulator